MIRQIGIIHGTERETGLEVSYRFVFTQAVSDPTRNADFTCRRRSSRSWGFNNVYAFRVSGPRDMRREVEGNFS